MLGWLSWAAGWRSWPLHEAAEKGDAETVRLLLEGTSSADVSVPRRAHRFAAAGDTPLMLAIRADSEECVRLLGAAGAYAGRREAQEAFSRGKVEVVRALLEEASEGQPLEVYGEPDDGLCWLFQNELEEKTLETLLFDLLLPDSAMDPRDCRSLTNDGQSLLHLAAFHGYPTVCQRLLLMGLSPNAPAWGIGTPLEAAILSHVPLHRRLECVRVLLKGGARLDAYSYPSQDYVDRAPDDIDDPQVFADTSGPTVADALRGVDDRDGHNELLGVLGVVTNRD